MEEIILNQLLKNAVYTKKVIPFLKAEYFESFEDKTIFKIMKAYFNRYKAEKLPTSSILKIALSKSKNITESNFEDINNRIDEINQSTEEYNFDWLIDSTEEHCKNKAIEDAIIKSVDIIENDGNKGQIEDLIRKALLTSFETSIGIDFFDAESIDQRWDYYNRDVPKFNTRIKKLNAILNGGFEEKTLSVFMGNAHAGKSASMVSICADLIHQGYDCLYVTLEMAEEKIAQRVEANYLNIPINDIEDMSETEYKSRLKGMKSKYGRLFVKEFPTSCAGTSHLRMLLEDLKLKKEFKPKIIFVDYINIMKSDRYTDKDSYTVVKAICEELRGLAVEGNFVIISATQTNRGGDNSSDLSMSDVAESYGLNATADNIFGIISTNELKEQGIQIWKAIKNRTGGVIDYKFAVKPEFEYSRLIDVKKEDDVEIQNTPESVAKMKKLLAKRTNKKVKIEVNKEKVIEDCEDMFTLQDKSIYVKMDLKIKRIIDEIV